MTFCILLSIWHIWLYTFDELGESFVPISILLQLIKWTIQNFIDLVEEYCDSFIAVCFFSFHPISGLKTASCNLESMPKQLLLKGLKMNDSKLCKPFHYQLSTAHYFDTRESMFLKQGLISFHLHIDSLRWGKLKAFIESIHSTYETMAHSCKDCLELF